MNLGVCGGVILLFKMACKPTAWVPSSALSKKAGLRLREKEALAGLRAQWGQRRGSLWLRALQCCSPEFSGNQKYAHIEV